MSTSQVYAIDPKSAAGEVIDGEAVIISHIFGTYYSAQGVGAEVWEFLEQGLSVAEMVHLLGARYDASAEAITESLNSFLSELAKHKLIVERETRSVNGELEAPEANGAALLPFSAPVLETYSDMQDIFLLDPIHDVDEAKGWPAQK